MVTVPDELLIDTIPPDCSVNDPPPFDNVLVYDVVPEWLYVCNSLVVEPSTSVAEMVMFVPLAENETMPPAVNVTSLPVDEFNVTGDDVPVKLKSVFPVAVDAMVTIPSDPVPVVVNVIPEPSANLNDPPELDNVTVCDVASDVLANVCNSFVVEPSTSVAVNVIEPPLDDVDSLIARMPAALIVTALAPDVLDNNVDDVPDPAPTPNTPSLVIDPSTSVALNVTVPAEWLMEMMPVDCSVNDPPELDNVLVYDVVPEWLYVCNSFVGDASAAAMVTMPSNDVPVVVNVMPEPSTN